MEIPRLTSLSTFVTELFKLRAKQSHGMYYHPVPLPGHSSTFLEIKRCGQIFAERGQQNPVDFNPPQVDAQYFCSTELTRA